MKVKHMNFVPTNQAISELFQLCQQFILLYVDNKLKHKKKAGNMHMEIASMPILVQP